MNDVDERLTRAGEQFRDDAAPPPSLDAMLDAATAPRHRARVILPVAASVLAVAGVAIAVPLARSSSPGHRAGASQSPTTRPSGAPGSIYVGDETWSGPVLDRSQPNVVYVYADQTGAHGSWGTACTTVPVARIVSQTPGTVAVAVGRYAKPLPPPPPGSENACSGEGLGLKRLKIVLAQPLGNRSLVDATDGTIRWVLDPATVLEPGYLPAGYTGGQVSWGGDSTAVRRYDGPGSRLTITVGPVTLGEPMLRGIGHTTVRGHPADVAYRGGFAQDVLITWNEDATHAATLYQMSNYDKRHPALSVAELIRIAQSLH